MSDVFFCTLLLHPEATSAAIRTKNKHLAKLSSLIFEVLIMICEFAFYLRQWRAIIHYKYPFINIIVEYSPHHMGTSASFHPWKENQSFLLYLTGKKQDRREDSF